MSSPHVLIVEDDASLADRYVTQLCGTYETTVAYDGQEAVEKLTEIGEAIDVALLDRMMVDVSGDEVLEEIQERELDCATAMVTAVDPDFDIVQLGIDDYLTKPVTKQELHDTVERLGTRSGYDSHVRDHLALISKRKTLREEKGRAELERSEEYTTLDEQIVESRDRLDAALSDDVFVNVLLSETGERLYTVIEYESESWSVRYESDHIEERIAKIEPNIDGILDQFRQESAQKRRLDTAYDLRGFQCSLHLFGEIVLVHFSQDTDSGLVCGFDPGTASHLTEFVDLVSPYLDPSA